MTRRIDHPSLTTQRRTECIETLTALADEAASRLVSSTLLSAAAIIRSQLRMEEIVAGSQPQPLVRLGQGAYTRDIVPDENGKLTTT